MFRILGRLESRAGELVASARGSRWADMIERSIDRFHRRANNVNFDMATNGELRVLEIISKTHPKTLLDVGANQGEWSELAASLNVSSTVYAFEIVPQTFSLLEKRVTDYSGIRPINVGLSDQEGRITIHLGCDHSVATAFPLAGTAMHSAYYRETIECQTRRADAYLNELGVTQVDFLKIDVEGMDLRVIRGFGDSIRQVKAIQFEYGIFNISSHDLLFDFCTYLSAHGFIVGKIFPQSVIFFEYNFNMENFHGSNYIAVQRGETAIISSLKDG